MGKGEKRNRVKVSIGQGAESLRVKVLKKQV